jgi:hypothetical protein
VNFFKGFYQKLFNKRRYGGVAVTCKSGGDHRMFINLDREGTVEGLQYLLEQAVGDEETLGILILACDANGFTPELVDGVLKECKKPVFGGVFSQILFNKERLEKGTVVAGICQPVSTTVIRDIGDISVDLEEMATFEWQALQNKTMFVFVDGLSQHVSALMESIFDCCGLFPNYIGRAKILASVTVGIGQLEGGEQVSAKIVFVRDRRTKKKWLALLTTDTELPDEEVVRIYGKRWSIEVFFKMSKSYLKLAKEFQGRSYDSMVASTAIVFIRYIMLSLESRNGEDLRTIGQLFYICCDELKDISLTEALQKLLTLLERFLGERLQLAEQEIRRLIDYLIGNLPSFFKERLAICCCES